LKARRRVTDAKIAAAVGMSTTAVNDRMRGTTACSSSDLVAFANYFEVKVTALFESEPPIFLVTSFAPLATPLGQVPLFDPDAPIVPRSLELVKA
jgi:hypothetical protein